MIKIICDKLPRILKNKTNLEKELKVKITNKGKEISIDGEPEAEYDAEKVIQALDLGFVYSVAVMLAEGETMLEMIRIKDYTPKRDFKRIRARIIGKNGKTLKTLSQLTKCEFELKDNEVGIIGDPEYIKNAQDAVISLIKGSKQANVYAYLEKHQVKPVFDLGLKGKEKSA